MSHAIFGTRPSLVWTLSKPHPHVWLRCPDTEDRLNWALPRWDRGPWSPGSGYLLLLPPPQRPTAHSPRTPSVLRLGPSTQGFAPPRASLFPHSGLGSCPGVQRPRVSLDGSISPSDRHVTLLRLPPPQTRSCQQLCNFPQPTSGPARTAPCSWMLPGGPSLGQGPRFLLAALASVPV